MPRLQLTEGEYDALYILFMNIGGDPANSKRKHIQTMLTQMNARYDKRRNRKKLHRSDARFDKHFYMVDGERMYWKNDNGVPDYSFTK